MSDAPRVLAIDEPRRPSWAERRHVLDVLNLVDAYRPIVGALPPSLRRMPMPEPDPGPRYNRTREASRRRRQVEAPK